MQTLGRNCQVHQNSQSKLAGGNILQVKQEAPPLARGIRKSILVTLLFLLMQCKYTLFLGQFVRQYSTLVFEVYRIKVANVDASTTLPFCALHLKQWSYECTRSSLFFFFAI